MEVSLYGDHPEVGCKNLQVATLVLMEPSGQCWSSGDLGDRTTRLIGELREGLLQAVTLCYGERT